MVKVTVSKTRRGKPEKPPVEPVDPPPVEPVDPPPGNPVSGNFKGTVTPTGGEAKEVEGTYSGTADADTGEFSVMGVLIAQPSAAVPVISVAPTLSPTTAGIGVLLTSTTGSWTNTPTSYAYQWMRGGVDISGATSSTYTTVSGDNGTTVTCKVRATNAAGPAAAYVTTSNSCVVSSSETVANQTVYFATKTVATKGGAKALSSLGNEVDFVSVDSVVSGTGTGWTVTSGRLNRSTATPTGSNGAVLRCTTSLGQIDVTLSITVVGYDAKDDTEASTAIGAMTQGESLCLRTATYSFIGFFSKSYAVETFCTRHAGAIPTVQNGAISASNHVTFDGIRFYINSYGPALPAPALVILDVYSGSAFTRVKNCSFEAGYRNPSTEGGTSFGTNTRGIFGNSILGIEIDHCTFTQLGYGMVLISGTNPVWIHDCASIYTLADCFNFGAVVTGNSSYLIEDCTFQDIYTTDPGTHGDAIQFQAGGIGENWQNITVRRCKVVHTSGLSQDPYTCGMQGIFFSNMGPTYSWENCTLEYNTVQINQNAGIGFGYAKNCTIQHNTLTRSDVGGDTISPSIVLGNNPGELSGTNNLDYNVAETIIKDGVAHVGTNWPIGTKDATKYNAAFVGPYTVPTSLADMMAKSAPKPAGPLTGTPYIGSIAP